MDHVTRQRKEDPWARTVRLLGWVSASADGRMDRSISALLPRNTRRGSSTLRKSIKSLAEIEILERLSDVTAAVSWHDATLCNYESQIWRAGLARIAGVCAMTGAKIIPGEPIYRPIGQPVNAGAMIPTAVMERVLGAVLDNDDA